MKPLSRPLRIHTSVLLLAALGACGKSKSRSTLPSPFPAEPLKATWDWPLAGETTLVSRSGDVTLPAQEPHWA